MQEKEQILIGHVTELRVFTVPEFGTRASFKLDRGGQCSIICCVAEDVAREFVTYYREGDIVAVQGNHESRPSGFREDALGWPLSCPWSPCPRSRPRCRMSAQRIG